MWTLLIRSSENIGWKYVINLNPNAASYLSQTYHTIQGWIFNSYSNTLFSRMMYDVNFPACHILVDVYVNVPYPEIIMKEKA
jgi:hypothetical protein